LLFMLSPTSPAHTYHDAWVVLSEIQTVGVAHHGIRPNAARRRNVEIIAAKATNISETADRVGTRGRTDQIDDGGARKSSPAGCANWRRMIRRKRAPGSAVAPMQRTAASFSQRAIARRMGCPVTLKFADSVGEFLLAGPPRGAEPHLQFELHLEAIGRWEAGAGTDFPRTRE
jgi:hypothetical protein